MNKGIFGFPGSSLDDNAGQITRLEPGYVAQSAAPSQFPGSSAALNPGGWVSLNPYCPQWKNIDLVIGGNHGSGSLRTSISGNTPRLSYSSGAYTVDFSGPDSRDNTTWAPERTSWGSYATAPGGPDNRAIGFYSVAGGTGNVASGIYSAAPGNQLLNAIGISSVSIGSGLASSTGDYSLSGGQNNLAISSYSGIFCGLSGITNHRGELSHSASTFSVAGSVNQSTSVQRVQTTDNSPTILTFDGNTVSASNESIYILDAQSIYLYNISISAIQSGGSAGTIGDSAWWVIQGAIRRDASNNTTLFGPPVSETDSNSGSLNWQASVLADDVNDALVISVTGEINKTIRWVASINLVKVTY